MEPTKKDWKHISKESTNADIIEMRVKSETFLTVSLGSFHVMSFYFHFESMKLFL